MITVEISAFQQRPKWSIHWVSRSSFFPWAPWSSRSIDFPVDLLPFMDKTAFYFWSSGLLCCFLNSFIARVASYLHLTCHTWGPSFSHLNSFCPFSPLLWLLLLCKMDAKVFMWAPTLLIYGIFSCPSMNVLEVFPDFLQGINFVKCYLQFEHKALVNLNMVSTWRDDMRGPFLSFCSCSEGWMWVNCVHNYSNHRLFCVSISVWSWNQTQIITLLSWFYN